MSLTIEDLIKVLKDEGKKMPMGLKTPIFEIEVDNLHNSGHSIYPGKFNPDIRFYRDSLGDITLTFHGI